MKAHRGAAFADFNGDGRIDAVVSSLGEPAELWENVSPAAQHWIVLRLTGTKSNRDGIGARIRIGNQLAEMTTRGWAMLRPSRIRACISDWGGAPACRRSKFAGRAEPSRRLPG